MESAVLYEEIKKTNIKLEKLEKLKSEFISIVSHELRTPLTAIKNSLDIMLSGKAGEITKIMDNFLNMASRNVSRLSGIINDLLDLSKIEAGKMEYRFESLNIAEPVEFVKNTFEHTAQKKNINIVLCLEKTLPQIYGDINRIEQILSNLVSNAIKFTPENGQITISAKIIDSKALDTSKFYHDTSAVTVKPPLILRGHYVKISVEDTGIGIKEEDIPKVFDKFQQIESSLSREVGGTGLGLPIARQLIEAHRGEIWVDSEVGKGTKFCFILPAMEHHNTFLLELDNELQHAKYSHSSFVLMLIEEKMHSGGHISITHDIADGKINIIRKRDKSKIFVQNGIALNKMQIILPNTDKLGVNFVIKRLEEFLNENAVEYACQDIFTGITVYPDDAITSEEILEHALKDMHCIHKTNNIN
jgi:signal transduction histidine kinase